MKTRIALFLICLLAINLSAKTISEQEAYIIAKQFLQERGKVVKSRMRTSATNDNPTNGQNVNSGYYIFNNGTNDGFVIVACNDCIAPVIGYSMTGTLDANNIPTNMKGWLEIYKKQIASSDEQIISSEISKQKSRHAIEPIIQTSWGQGNPYNSLCPEIMGSRTVTGCVSTAMAQVINYHKYPDTTNPIPSYSINYNNLDKWTSEELPGVQFDWNNMLPEYNGNNYNEKERIAVATLIKYAGHSVKTIYNGYSSSAKASDCEDALRDYFKFDHRLRRVSRSNTAQVEDWEDIIYKELESNRPVLYFATTTTNKYGHAFVCDGYDGEGYFHINWGWDGTCDGYFRLQALNPNGQGTGGSNDLEGYSSNQEIIIGIQPTREHDDLFVADRLTTVSITSDAENHLRSGNGTFNIKLKLSLQNTSDTASTYHCCIGIFDKDSLLQMGNSSTINLKSYETATYYNFKQTGFKGITDGKYQLKVLSKLCNDTIWHINNASGKHFIAAKVDQDTLRLYNNVPSLDIIKLKAEPALIGNEKACIRATIKNNGNNDFKGELHLWANGKRRTGEGAYIAAGSIDSIDFYIDRIEPTNNVEIKISLDIQGNDVLYKDTLEVLNELPNSESFEIISIDYDHFIPYNNIFFRKDIKGTIRIKNTGKNRFNGELYLTMDASYRNSVMTLQYPFSKYINANEEQNLDFNFNYLSAYLSYDTNIKFYITTNKDKTKGVIWESPQYTIAHAAPMWNKGRQLKAMNLTTHPVKVPDEAVAVDLRNVDMPSEILPNKNRNCLYYLSKDIIPSGIEKCNLINNSHAENLVLTDSMDFYAPFSFEAKNIRYTRMFGKHDKETIIMPFKVENVLANGTPLKLYEGESDIIESYILYEYTNSQDSTLFFDYADEWHSGTPYILLIPDSIWNDSINKNERQLILQATDATIYKSPTENSMCWGDYMFTGYTNSNTSTDYYSLNDNSSFEYNQDGQLLPFRAYFTNINNDICKKLLPIKIPEIETSSIWVPYYNEPNKHYVYTLSGRKIANIRPIDNNVLPNMSRGIYIINGKKYIVK